MHGPPQHQDAATTMNHTLGHADLVKKTTSLRDEQQSDLSQGYELMS